MRFVVVGAGGIGGFVAGRLALAGHDVVVVARGANLAAIQAGGLTIIEQDGRTRLAQVAAFQNASAVPAADVVILAVKAHQLTQVAPSVAPLLDRGGCAVTMQNGVPYWYFEGHDGPLAGCHLRSVDPDGTIATYIPARRVLGCVVYPACILESPGVVRHVEGTRFPLGELDGTISQRATQVSECFEEAGLKAPVLANIRDEIWLKLWGNLTFNPLSALTRSTLADICGDTHTRALAAGMMAEAQDIAEKLGVTFRVPIERRIAGAERVGAHKTSMLQDLEAARELEIDALLGSVIELAHLTQTPATRLETVYALVKRLEAQTLARN